MFFIPSFAHFAFQNVNKDYATFSYFRNFVAESDQKPKTKLGNSVNALHVKVAFFHTLVIHACVLCSTSRLRTADLREMKAYTSIAPFQSTADS